DAANAAVVGRRAEAERHAGPRLVRRTGSRGAKKLGWAFMTGHASSVARAPASAQRSAVMLRQPPAPAQRTVVRTFAISSRYTLTTAGSYEASNFSATGRVRSCILISVEAGTSLICIPLASSSLRALIAASRLVLRSNAPASTAAS